MDSELNEESISERKHDYKFLPFSGRIQKKSVIYNLRGEFTNVYIYMYVNTLMNVYWRKEEI